MALAVVAGYLAGLIVALLTIGAENSRIAFGGYALSGNGALIVPAILSPYALYPGWALSLAQEGDRRLEAALYTGGLYFGVGSISILEAAFFPQSADVTLLSAVPGFLVTGALFVIPAALFGAATLWLVRSGHIAITPLTAAFGIVIGFWDRHRRSDSAAVRRRARHPRRWCGRARPAATRAEDDDRRGVARPARHRRQRAVHPGALHAERSDSLKTRTTSSGLPLHGAAAPLAAERLAARPAERTAPRVRSARVRLAWRRPAAADRRDGSRPWDGTRRPGGTHRPAATGRARAWAAAVRRPSRAPAVT